MVSRGLVHVLLVLVPALVLVLVHVLLVHVPVLLVLVHVLLVHVPVRVLVLQLIVDNERNILSPDSVEIMYSRSDSMLLFLLLSPEVIF